MRLREGLVFEVVCNMLAWVAPSGSFSSAVKALSMGPLELMGAAEEFDG
jgi:hypothetical protein